MSGATAAPEIIQTLEALSNLSVWGEPLYLSVNISPQCVTLEVTLGSEGIAWVAACGGPLESRLEDCTVVAAEKVAKWNRDHNLMLEETPCPTSDSGSTNPAPMVFM